MEVWKFGGLEVWLAASFVARKGVPVSLASPESPAASSFWHVADVPAGAGGVSPCRVVGQRPTTTNPLILQIVFVAIEISKNTLAVLPAVAGP